MRIIPAIITASLVAVLLMLPCAAQIVPAVAPAEATSGNPSVAPYKWAGLLIIPSPTKDDAKRAVFCTAQFVASNVLLTAGHCIRNVADNPDGPWPDPTKGAFWLQYQNDSGTPFHILCAKTNPLWSLPANYDSLSKTQQAAAVDAAQQHDYAMVLVDGRSPTGTVPYALDWRGKYNYADRIGYPNDILDGAIIQDAPGVVFFGSDIPIGQYSSPNLVMQWGPITDATEGMSGGGWIANLSQSEGPGKNVLIAVTSFGAVTEDGTQIFPGGTFAAYLTAAEFDPLLSSVSNGCR
jgi:hypothetical protein